MTDSTLKLARLCGVEVKGVLRLLCSGKYTGKLKAKFYDSHIEIGDFYSIYFLDKQPSTYVVLFRNKAMSHCQTLSPTNGTKFHCFDGIDKNSTMVILGKTDYVTCMHHSSTYTDVLMEACGVKWSSPYPMVTIMHYRALEQSKHLDTSSASCQFQWECLMIILILSLLLCLFYGIR